MSKKQIFSTLGEDNCRHSWCNRQKIPDVIRVSFCTICGKERIEHDRDETDENIINHVHSKGVEFGE